MNLLLIALAAAISFAVAVFTFSIFWLLWLRAMLARLNRVEHVLKESQKYFSYYHEKLDTFSRTLSSCSPTHSTHIIEIDPSLSIEERQRLIQYLRSEGFIP